MIRRFTAVVFVLALCGFVRPGPVDAQPVLREIARFGSPGGDVYFEDVVAAAAFEGDRVAVLDRRARRVALLTLADRGVRWIGAPGEGPGEFTRPVALISRSDALAVADFGRGPHHLRPRRGAVGDDAGAGGPPAEHGVVA